MVKGARNVSADDANCTKTSGSLDTVGAAGYNNPIMVWSCVKAPSNNSRSVVFTVMNGARARVLSLWPRPAT